MAGMVALATFALYLPALRNRFVNWDDLQYVLENERIRALDPAFFRWAFFGFYLGNWHPLTWISHALDYAAWGLRPMGHHLTSLVLHAGNTFLVAILVAALVEAWEAGRGARVRSLVAGGVTGLLFGIHPLHVESVAWVSERKDVLCALFFLGSLLAYVSYARRGGLPAAPGSALRNGTYLSALGLFALALLAKAMAVTLPAVLLILDWMPLRRIRSGRTLRACSLEKLPFFGLSLGAAVVAFVAQRAAGAMGDIPPPLSVRAIVAAHAPAVYVFKILWPTGLSPFYPYPSDIALFSAREGIPVLFTVAATFACVLLARRNGVWLAAWGYYLITLLPVSGLVAQVGIQLLADRYTYLPSLGPFVLAGVGAGSLAASLVSRRKPNVAAGVGAAAVALAAAFCLAVLTVRQIGVWKDGFALWSYVLAREPSRIPSAYVNRGTLYLEQGEYERAIADFDQALALQPMRFRVFLTPGHFREAFEKRESAKQLAGQRTERQAGEHDAAAIREYESALARNPADLPARISLGVLYAKVGSIEKGIEQFGAAIRIAPRSALAYGNRGYAYALLGRTGEAFADFDRAIALDPRYIGAYVKRGNLLLKTGNAARARADFEAACRLGSEEACASARGLPVVPGN